ncbi:hypothetical protein QQG74_02470 [Micromonospora sp. FIMYZ51]|uniref:hypothetical protein n=1 Tax=Micromonospora sp. FIMYZ51 TaxID=3051832 RepID=UPI00311EFA89
MTPTVTGVGWSSLFADYADEPGAAFLGPHDLLPDDRWDRGIRVSCLHDLLRQLLPALSSVRLVTSAPAADPQTIMQFHKPQYARSQGLLEPVEPDGRLAAGLHAVGTVLELCDQVWARELTNAYALVRPAGHHSEPNSAGGGCLFANGVLAVLRARQHGAERVLVVDWDAHHGNSQQHAFWEDPAVLTISVHQDRAFPPGTGGTDARGAGQGFGSNINVPVPMGSGGGVYRAVFEDVIIPAAERFRPDLVLVASGLDASYLDPSARLALHSGDYGWMTQQLVDVADRYANGRLLMTHEGGYALSYLPLCFLRIIESLSGDRTEVADPFLERWGTTFASAVSAEARATIRHCRQLAGDVPR